MKSLKVSQIAYLGQLELKHVGKIVCVGIYAGFEAGRMQELKHKSCRGNIVYLGIEAGKKYCLCRN